MVKLKQHQGCYLPHNHAIDKIGSIGKSIPGGKFKIFNSFNKETSVNKEGELVYYGKCIYGLCKFSNRAKQT